MSGALAERVFAHKVEAVGFSELRILARSRFTLDDAARYPLFTPDLIALMRELLGPRQQEEVAIAVTLAATKPGHLETSVETSREEAPR